MDREKGRKRKGGRERGWETWSQNEGERERRDGLREKEQRGMNEDKRVRNR